MSLQRASGILLHPTSLPGEFGIGDLGESARKFIDFLAAAGQKYWQVLPLGPTGYGNSPYMCYSAFAGNPLLISPGDLLELGYLTKADLAELSSAKNWPDDLPAAMLRERVDYEGVINFKIGILKKAFGQFKTRGLQDKEQKNYLEFCNTNAHWVDDYALFMTLREVNKGSSWYEWDSAIATRDKTALQQARELYSDQFECHRFWQYIFAEQWKSLRELANKNKVEIVGDIPIYVAHDSADVWANQELFAIDPETGLVDEMAGVPPDYFSETGQLWGNPVYKWGALQATNFDWWIDRFQHLLKMVDLIRIDHFRGFQAFWSVPKGEETAINGEWVEAPGIEFFETVRKRLGSLPILAEDLGVITDEVNALRDRFEFPGMKVLQFAFGDNNANPFLPFNYSHNFVVYTGTHDNDTTVGWFSQCDDYNRQRVTNYLGGSISPAGIHWDFLRLAWSSVATIAIAPCQDILGLDTNYRMNTPGTATGNWEWRLQPAALNSTLAEQLRHLTETYGRSY
jgi:4-alpha-glucanotransferase